MSVRDQSDYPLAVSTLVGREPELAEVARVPAGPTKAEAALAIVGRARHRQDRRLGRRPSRLARELGALVLAARPAESEATLSFAGLTDLLAELDPRLFEELPPPQRHALEVAVLRTASERPAERRLVGTALLSLLRALAADGRSCSRSTTRTGSTRPPLPPSPSPPGGSPAARCG